MYLASAGDANNFNILAKALLENPDDQFWSGLQWGFTEPLTPGPEPLVPANSL